VTATGTPSIGPAPLDVAFTTTVVGGSPPYTYAWTFGDGGTGTGADPDHTYVSPGTYVAEVEVTDAAARTGSATVTTIVTVPAVTSPGLSARRARFYPATS